MHRETQMPCVSLTFDVCEFLLRREALGSQEQSTMDPEFNFTHPPTMHLFKMVKLRRRKKESAYCLHLTCISFVSFRGDPGLD
jgi:hypothetical protein